MNAHEFVAHAIAQKFSSAQVQRQFPHLPYEVCASLLTGEAKIDHIKPDGTVVVDDGKNFIAIITCRGWVFRTEPMLRRTAEICVKDFASANPGVPKPLILETANEKL